MLTPVVIVALVVLFLHVCTWEGMIFQRVADALWKQPEWLKKPLYDCPICMTIWWGPSTLACGILGQAWAVTNIWQLGIICAAAAGINAVLIYIITANKAEGQWIKGELQDGQNSENL